MSLELSDTRVCEPQIPARLGPTTDLLLAEVSGLGLVLRLLVQVQVPVREPLRFSVFIAWYVHETE